ncbi:hypothetical protein PT015_24300 [Candidatus Mycobacterium wuenschmannii]|uniref:PE-PGRS family protein n=1 Tax=Candidatus Mycobacterium wuenschmannii TaxID=3027808 RepID=A0ABY8VX63_9MYCO|nr:hypothetical protein [Candidatus Mycobacterium wuenschmannii]WIM87901.1 hypothetical protein PT015_24300 [Candidatus Mycobacterium wuenschmannii]
MAFDTPLNQRQLDVLRWISDGCPDGRWTDFTFKTTAAALAWRRLVAVSKRGGVWSAATLPAGEHYLMKGTYPQGHWTKKARAPRVAHDAPLITLAVPERPVDQRRDIPARASSKDHSPSPARQLLAEVLAAGGEIQRESKEGRRPYAVLAAAVNRHKLAPEGKQLTVEMGSRWEVSVIRLEDAPRWLTTPAPEVVDAQRIAGWHPALGNLRERDFMTMTTISQRRMLRILQALAVEADARGHRVGAANPPGRRHYRQSEAGHIAIRIRDYRYTIAVWQKYREAPPPRWGKPVKRPDAAVGDSLAVGLIWESGGRSGISETWSDTPAKRTRVESLLPAILWEIERQSVQSDRRREQERLAAIERERLQAEAERQARVFHAQNVRAEVLRDQHARWREGLQLREYISAMDRAIEQLPDHIDRLAASGWRSWCQEYLDTVLDPLGQPLAMPEIREWTRDERDALISDILRRLKNAADS